MGLRELFMGGQRSEAGPPPAPAKKEPPRVSKAARTRIGAMLARTEPHWRSTQSRDLARMLDRGNVVDDPVFQHVADALEVGHGIAVPRMMNDFQTLAGSSLEDGPLLLAVAYAANYLPTPLPRHHDASQFFTVSGAQLLDMVNEALALDGFDLRVTLKGYEPAVPDEREAKPEDKFRTLRAYSELSVDFEAWSKDGEPMAFLFFDIDNFKLGCNSRLTETVVDAVILGPLHRLLKKEVGSRGGAYAMGKGDEFGVLLRNVTPEEARLFAKRLHGAIAAASFPNADKAPEQVTVSMGLACCPRDAATMENLRLKANGAEHDAKEAGKKCIYEHGFGRVT